MMVYNAGSYGRANLMTRPGIDEPSDARWFRVETDERGELRRIARQIVVSFKDGAAEVTEDLARYLLEKGLVSAEPLPFTPPPQPATFAEAFAPPEPRKPPIAVGGQMTSKIAASQARCLGEQMTPRQHETQPPRRRNRKKPPLAVGSTMTPEAAASQARILGERVRR